MTSNALPVESSPRRFTARPLHAERPAGIWVVYDAASGRRFGRYPSVYAAGAEAGRLNLLGDVRGRAAASAATFAEAGQLLLSAGAAGLVQAGKRKPAGRG